MPEPILSVVVCTHNRPGDLTRCLAALAACAEPVEVVVVDSASQPDCRSLVEHWHPRIPALRYVREDGPGLSRARNRGLREATAGIVAFLDDDAAPRAGWARSLVAAFDGDPRIGCVGGACTAVFRDGAERPAWLSERLLQFAGVTRFGSRAREARSTSEFPFGANIAFRVRALPGDETFAERLGRHGKTLLSGEELALVEEIRAAGWKVWLEPDAVVEHTVHPERCESQYYWRRLWWAGVSRARATEAAVSLGLKLLAAVPIRLGLYLATRDRVHLYRTAETAGFLHERVRLLRRAA
jgi:GT2 family glycosyltransferase